MRHSAFLYSVIWLAPSPSGASDLAALVEALTDRFAQECTAAIQAPAEYIAAAKTAPPDVGVTVIESPRGDIHFVQHVAPEGEVAIRFMRAEHDRLRIFCQAAHFNNPLLMDADATEEALEQFLAAREDIRRVGGLMDMTEPVVGRATETGQMMQHVSPIHHHLLTGWSDRPQIALAWIQMNMYELTATAVVTATLEDG